MSMAKNMALGTDSLSVFHTARPIDHEKPRHLSEEKPRVRDGKGLAPGHARPDSQDQHSVKPTRQRLNTAEPMPMPHSRAQNDTL